MKNRLANKNKIGEEFINNQGLKFKIIDYRNCEDIDIQFEDGTTMYHSCYKIFKKGQPINPNQPYIYGVGYRGIGKYQAIVDGKREKCYDTWRDMIKRCYDSKSLAVRPTYKECSVCDEWHNYQNFARWYEENFYQVDDEEMQLDKDILFKHNKVYSPETCIFVPKRINSLFIKSDALRGLLPIGVRKVKNGYMSCLCGKYIGTYSTIDEAFNSYKNAKENMIKEVAEQYKNKIPQKLYEAMLKYEVEITD